MEYFYTWWFDASSLFIRYFFLAGIAYGVFYVWNHKKLASLKIQKEIPSGKRVYKEILFSVFTLIIYCGMSWLVFYFYKLSVTRIYPDINQYGYFYFGFSIVLMILIHDAYFYWTHRFMHLPWVFKRVHKVHHLSKNPTPWAAFSFHPLEAIISTGIIVIIVFVIPAHPMALFIFLSIMILINVMGHLGYETFPLKFRKSKIGKWQNTSTNHNVHHQYAHTNYGLYFNFWDKLMGTFE